MEKEEKRAALIKLQINSLNTQWRKCKDCALAKGRTQVVLGSGDPIKAIALIVGQSPGAEEDKTGIPFVGAAGKLLFDTFNEFNMPRELFYVTNIMLCYIKPKIEPDRNWVIQCQTKLTALINVIRPRIIIPVGKFATQHFIPTSSITQVTGTITSVNISLFNMASPKLDNEQYGYSLKDFPVKIAPLIHPASVLYNPGNRELFRDSVKEIRQWLLPS